MAGLAGKSGWLARSPAYDDGMKQSHKSEETLPLDGQRILGLAARSMFDLFANASEGMLLVDREARVVWINDQYRRYLPALGFPREEDFVGHKVSEVVQNTQMHRVIQTGKPILIDLLSNKAGTFVVSRIPLRDEQGEVIGALGIVLFDHPETTLQPLIHKFANLQRDLDDAKRELATQRRNKYTLASFVGSSPAATEVKRQARRAAMSSSPVLLLGETGTGKELLAHAIHGVAAHAEDGVERAGDEEGRHRRARSRKGAEALVVRIEVPVIRHRPEET